MKSKTYKIYNNNKKITKEIYINKSQIPKKRNNSTYNLKKLLKDRELKFKPRLCDVVFSSGFVTSIEESKHIILNNNILLNNKVFNKPNKILKSGDIITCIYNKVLLNYYKRRWDILDFNKDNTYIKYKYLISNKKIIRLSYNSILWL